MVVVIARLPSSHSLASLLKRMIPVIVRVILTLFQILQRRIVPRRLRQGIGCCMSQVRRRCLLWHVRRRKKEVGVGLPKRHSGLKSRGRRQFGELIRLLRQESSRVFSFSQHRDKFLKVTYHELQIISLRCRIGPLWMMRGGQQGGIGKLSHDVCMSCSCGCSRMMMRMRMKGGRVWINWLRGRPSRRRHGCCRGCGYGG